MKFMKSIMFKVLFLLSLMAGVGGCGGGDSGSSVSNHGKISLYSVGQAGTNASPWGDGSLAQRPAMAVKFTPASYPVTITSVTIYALNNSGSDQSFNVYGFSDLQAETPVFDAVLNNSIPDTGLTIQPKTINIPATTIASGSFYIAVEWVTKPLVSLSGANAFFLHTDGSMNNPSTSYFRFSGTTWLPVESVSATAGDVGIEVNY